MNADDIEALRVGAEALLDEASRCDVMWRPEHDIVAHQAAERRAGLMRVDAARLTALADDAERGPSRGELLAGLRALYHGYVCTLEAGRDRIIDFGGECDPVDRMEEGDPKLISARALIACAGDT